MPPTPAEFAAQLANPMGYYYLLAAAANVVAAGMAWKRKRHRVKEHCSLDCSFAVGFGLLAALAFRGSPAGNARRLENRDRRRLHAGRAVCSLSSLRLSLLYLAREFFVKPAVAWIGFNARDVVLRRIADRSELFRRRHAAGRRADRGDGLFARLFPLAGDVSSRGKRPPNDSLADSEKAG